VNGVPNLTNETRADLTRQLALYGEARAVATGLDYTRYDEVVRAVGGFGAWVTEPSQLGPALDEAFAAKVPSCINVKLGASDFRKGAISV
jgi:acetolactate synthase-1/2/3 large subunit